MLETAVALLGYHAVAWLASSLIPKLEGSGVWHLVPYKAFQCQDDFILAGATNNAAWQRFCDAVDLPQLAIDERFTSNSSRAANRDLLIPILEQRFLERPAAEWISRLEAHKVAVAPINRIDQVLTHYQVLANAMVVEAGEA